MCGVAGIILASIQNVSESSLKAMGEKQHHRGPDYFGWFIHKNFGFAHNRLSILDLSSAGNQPFRNDRYVLVYNGEIYNYLELKEPLLKKGVVFKSTSDTAVLFEHLVHFGVEDTLKKIKGMFAFGFCDLQNEILWLCRDRLGIKPLVWSFEKGNLYWASEVKGLAPVISLEPDPLRTLFATASLGDLSPEFTVFKNVKQVRAGTYLVCKPGKLPETVRYYDIVSDVDQNYYRELEQMSQDKILSTFDSLLQKSVRGMLMSDAPMGSFVSGGIDSSLVTTLAVQEKKELQLFTANVLGQYSEFKDAQHLSNVLFQPLHSVHFRPEMMLEHWARTTYYYECPIVTHTNSIPFALVAGLARQKEVKAVLTGEGADECYMGYPMLLTGRLKKIIGFPLHLLRSLYGIIPKLRPYLFPALEESVDHFIKLLTQGFGEERLQERGLQAYSFLSPHSAFHHYQSISMIRRGLLALLHRNDRMGMIASIESRFPFLDEDLIRFAVNLPLKWKMRPTLRFHNYKHPFLLDKAIVRLLAKTVLPHPLVYKKKWGFGLYGHHSLRLKPGYFQKGYIPHLVGLNSAAEEYMIRKCNSYFIGKLVSVDIFGRLFALNHSWDHITKDLKEYVSIHT